jgi:hypothetical protein
MVDSESQTCWLFCIRDLQRKPILTCSYVNDPKPQFHRKLTAIYKPSLELDVLYAWLSSTPARYTLQTEKPNATISDLRGKLKDLLCSLECRDGNTAAIFDAWLEEPNQSMCL